MVVVIFYLVRCSGNTSLLSNNLKNLTLVPSIRWRRLPPQVPPVGTPETSWGVRPMHIPMLEAEDCYSFITLELGVRKQIPMMYEYKNVRDNHIFVGVPLRETKCIEVQSLICPPAFYCSLCKMKPEISGRKQTAFQL